MPKRKFQKYLKREGGNLVSGKNSISDQWKTSSTVSSIDLKKNSVVSYFRPNTKKKKHRNWRFHL